MTEAQIEKMVQLSRDGVLLKHIAERFGLSLSVVSHAVAARKRAAK